MAPHLGQARIRLGDAEAGAQVAADHLGQPFPFLRFAAVLDDRMQSENVDVDARAGGENTGRGARHPHHNRRFGHAQAGAAVLDGHGDA